MTKSIHEMLLGYLLPPNDQLRGADGVVNQLEKIITAIRNRESQSKAAYTLVIQNPGGETVQPLGGPCLNYVAVQIEPGQSTQTMILG